MLPATEKQEISSYLQKREKVRKQDRTDTMPYLKLPVFLVWICCTFLSLPRVFISGFNSFPTSEEKYNPSKFQFIRLIRNSQEHWMELSHNVEMLQHFIYSMYFYLFFFPSCFRPLWVCTMTRRWSIEWIQEVLSLRLRTRPALFNTTSQSPEIMRCLVAFIRERGRYFTKGKIQEINDRKWFLFFLTQTLEKILTEKHLWNCRQIWKDFEMW